MTLDARLNELLQRAQVEEAKYMDGMSDQELSDKGEADDWAPKDVFAHIAEWKAIIVNRISEHSTDDGSPLYDGEVDDTNAEIFDKYSSRPWSEVRRVLESANSELMTLIPLLSASELVDPDRAPWQRGRPLFQRIGHIGYFHSLRHLADLYLGRGDRDEADALAEGSTNEFLTLTDDPKWHGIYSYNLACYFALAGDKDKALNLLRKALPLRPQLVEWSQKDGDLESIWKDPEFISLVES